MKRQIMLLVLSLWLLMGSGCSFPGKQDGYQLYFVTDSSVSHGPALASEPYSGSKSKKEAAEPTPGELVQALLNGPSTEGLTSPFPKGLTFQWWDWDEEKSGNLRIGLSEQYGGLTDVSLTLADYCIVLTLSQLEGVESVEIISEGYMANYRSHQLLRPEEAVLTEPVLPGAPST